MPVVRKFEFDLSFDRASAKPAKPVAVVVAPEPPPPPPPPPEPTFSAAELEAARQQGWNDGKQAGESAVRAGLEQKVGNTAEHLAMVLGTLASEQTAVRNRLERQAVEATLVLARKLFPALTQRSGTLELEALLDDAFQQVLEEPRVIVRCPGDVRDAIEPLAHQAAHRTGFEGRVTVLSDATMAAGDCRVEWAEGGIERSPRRMIDAIEAAVERGLAEFDHRHGAAPGATSPVEEVRR